MSVRKLTARLIMVLVTMATAHSIHAQGPAVDPFAFDPDFRWFEPIYDADIADMKPKKRANTGWYATFDKLKLFASRPESADVQAGDTLLDSGQGTRYQVGYMLPQQETGWMFSWTKNTVGQNQYVRQERLNRFSLDGGQPIPPLGLIVPPADRNVIGHFYRFYDIKDSENVMDLDTFELNKTWRLEPYHYGGILEPMVGVRWMRLDDINMFQTYQSTNDAFSPILAGLGGIAFVGGELFTTQIARTDNELLTGQFGFRYYKHQGRFMYSTDFKVFTGGSFQTTRSQQHQELTVYAAAAPGAGTDPISVHDTQTKAVYSRNEEFVVGFDVRGEIGYQLTKAISIRGGFQVIDIGRGVWRGGDGTQGSLAAGDNDQDVQLLGGTFGITFNR